MQFLVIDDHGLIREALRSVLKELDPDSIVLEASNYEQATRMIEDNPGYGLIPRPAMASRNDRRWCWSSIMAISSEVRGRCLRIGMGSSSVDAIDCVRAIARRKSP
jgi:DNA-binding NarL/FixJ family response regulator